eukprot:746425-Hanusia_phi.AAC.9
MKVLQVREREGRGSYLTLRAVCFARSRRRLAGRRQEVRGRRAERGSEAGGTRWGKLEWRGSRGNQMSSWWS